MAQFVKSFESVDGPSVIFPINEFLKLRRMIGYISGAIRIAPYIEDSTVFSNAIDDIECKISDIDKLMEIQK